MKNNILEKIRTDEVKMRSKAYFRLKVALLAVVAFLVLLTSIALCSFVIFSLHESGRSFLLDFGSRGFFLFIVLFPWTLFILDAALILLLEKLLAKFSFAYRRPTIYLIGGILVIILTLGYAIDRVTDLHASLLDRADKGELPLFGGLYEQLRDQPAPTGICRCVITSINGNVLTLRDDHPEQGVSILRTFVIPADATTSSLRVGERLFIIQGIGFEKFVQ